MKLVALLTAAAFLACAADNSLTPEEKREGFRLLFDGKSMKGWKDPAKKSVPGNAWAIEDGTLTTVQKPKIEEDLISEKEYGDFELRWDWKLTPGGNTGLKYRLQREVFVDNSKAERGEGGFEGMLGRAMSNPRSDRAQLGANDTGFVYTIGFEYQLLDDNRHPDGKKNQSHRTGALYSFIPADKENAKTPGEWNSSRLIVKGDRFEHWLNGEKVLEGSLKDERVKAGAEKRWKPAPMVRDLLVNAKPRGPIALQHHGDKVWFRNIRLRELN